MALVALTMRVRLLWRDNDGAESTTIVNIPAATGFGSALSFLASWRPLASAISSAYCYGADLLIRYAENETWPAPAGTDVQREAVLIFGADPTSLAAVHVPSINLEYVLASGPYAGIALDTAAPALAAFIAALASGLAGVAACDPLAADLGELATAYMQQL